MHFLSEKHFEKQPQPHSQIQTGVTIIVVCFHVLKIIFKKIKFLFLN